MVRAAKGIGVYGRFAGAMLDNLELIRAYLYDLSEGKLTITRADALYAAVRMASDIVRGTYVRATKAERRYASRVEKYGRAYASGNTAAGPVNPWPAGTIALSRSGGADGAERERADPAPDNRHADNGVSDESEPEEPSAPGAHVRVRKSGRPSNRK